MPGLELGAERDQAYRPDTCPGWSSLRLPLAGLRPKMHTASYDQNHCNLSFALRFSLTNGYFDAWYSDGWTGGITHNTNISALLSSQD